jgi:hypothetical protein
MCKLKSNLQFQRWLALDAFRLDQTGCVLWDPESLQLGRQMHRGNVEC